MVSPFFTRIDILNDAWGGQAEGRTASLWGCFNSWSYWALGLVLSPSGSEGNNADSAKETEERLDKGGARLGESHVTKTQGEEIRTEKRSQWSTKEIISNLG